MDRLEPHTDAIELEPLDSIISDTTLTEEFFLAHRLYQFSLKDFREITIIAMKSAFLRHQDRVKMIKAIAGEFEDSFGLYGDFAKPR